MRLMAILNSFVAGVGGPVSTQYVTGEYRNACQEIAF